MPDISGAVAFVVMLAVLVAVHELGHFLTAKWLGVKVLKFSIGFGPRIIGFRRGETEYALSLLPLGGYVKMAGEQPGEELPPEEAARGFLTQPPWKRALIVAAGPAFNLVFPVLVYFVAYLGEYKTVSTRVGDVDPAFPAAAAGIRPGDRITAINGTPVKTWDDVKRHISKAFEQETLLSVSRAGTALDLRVTPARVLNVDPVEKVPQGRIGISAAGRPPVLGIAEGTPAHAAGLRTFDRVLAVDGQTVADDPALLDALRKGQGPVQLRVLRFESLDLPGASAQWPVTLDLRVERSPGEGLDVLGGAQRSDLFVGVVAKGSAAESAGIQVGDRLTSINGKPLKSLQMLLWALEELDDQSFKLGWLSGTEQRQAQLQRQAWAQADELGNRMSVPKLGIGPGYQLVPEVAQEEKLTVHFGAWEALRESLQVVPEVIRKMFLVIGRMVLGDLPFESMGGPILLYQLASKAQEMGLDAYLGLMALISVNLGVMNLLPIPVLDGFHLLAALWESVRRRPIPVRAREIANMVGLAMLALLMVMVFKNDLTRKPAPVEASRVLIL